MVNISKNVKRKTLKVLIKDYLHSGGDIRGLCEELGCSRSKVYEVLKRLDIKPPFKRGRPKKCP